ncbi:MAG: cobalamin B12-binding domain-containing protein [Pseudomonadota bacterium]
MDDQSANKDRGLSEAQRPAIRFLVESALRTVMTNTANREPRTRDEWIGRLCEALMSEAESSYHSVVAALISNGVTQEDVFQSYVPAAARYLGELWVSDRASFVDVTVAASRLQSLFRQQEDRIATRWTDRSVPLGQSVLVAIPEFEQHALGAFVAADNLRRHGLWVHMAIGLKNEELAELINSQRFAMIGISIATPNAVEQTTNLVDYIRANTNHTPPIVIGGRMVEENEKLVLRTGADHAVRTAREAIEKCGLASVAEALPFSGIS